MPPRWRVALLLLDCWRVWTVTLAERHPPATSLWPLHLRHVVRRWRADIAFPLATVGLLSAGIAAVTIVASMFSTLLLRPLPYPDPSRLVAVWPGQFVANREVETLERTATSYGALASFSPGWLMTLTGVPVAQQLDVERVSASYFPLFGATPLVGRAFDRGAEEPGHDHVVVLSEALWTSEFGRDPAVVGRSILLLNEPYRVVGVMSRSLRLLDTKADAWTPWTIDPTDWPWTKAGTMVFGRLSTAASPQTATAELRTLLSRMQAPYGHPSSWGEAASVTPLKEVLVGDARTTLTALIVAVGVLMLLAIANVGNLVSMRLADRREELALRAALGASIGQLRGLLFVESALLSVLAAALGLAVAAFALGGLRRALPADLPRVDELAFDPVTGLGVASCLALVLVALSLIPSAASLRPASIAYGARRTQTGRYRRSRGLLVSVEVGLAVVLAAGAALLGRTLVALHAVDPGVRIDHLLTMKVQPTGTEASIRTYWSTVLPAVEAVPGVTSAATILHLPTSGRSWQADLVVVGRPRPADGLAPRANWESVSPAYFRTAGQPVLEGRPFTPGDRADGPLVIALDTTAASRLFPGEPALGRRIIAGNATAGAEATIVAIVGPVHYDGLGVTPTPTVYVPFDQRPVFANSLLVRTTTPPAAVAAAITAAVRLADPNVPITEVRTMADRFAESLDQPRFVSVTLGSFALSGLLLAAVGVYTVVAFGVRERRRELGIRAALGADTWRLRRLVLAEGARYVSLGLGVGLPAALVGARSLQSLLFGVPALDPWSFAAVVITVVAMSAAASLTPAVRASSGDPLAVLKP